MGTPANIAIIQGDDVKMITVNTDGNLCGDILVNHYNQTNQVLSLFSMGDMFSVLSPVLQDCISHRVHWGRNVQDPQEMTLSHLRVLFDTFHEYTYVFDTANETWHRLSVLTGEMTKI